MTTKETGNIDTVITELHLAEYELQGLADGSTSLLRATTSAEVALASVRHAKRILEYMTRAREAGEKSC